MTRRGFQTIASLDAAPSLVGALVEVEIAGESQQVDASALGGGVPSTRTINTTAPLAGGGDLSADRTLSLSDAGVTYAKIQNVSATNRVLGRSTAGAGPVEEIVCTAAGRALIDDADAATQLNTLGAVGTGRTISTTAPLAGGGTLASDRTLTVSDFVASGGSHARGTVPDPGATPGTTKFLREDASWAVPPGTMPTGTGFTHMTAGAQDAAAKLVETADITAANVTYDRIQNVSATDKVLGRSSAGAGSVQEIACTAAGRALIDDADAAAQRTTLGLGTMAEWTPTVSATSATTGTMTVTMGEGVRTITPTGACTFNASGGVAGQRCTFAFTTSGTTSYTMTFGTNFRKVGTLATGTVTARYFSVTFVCINGTIWQEIGRTAAMT